MAIEANGQRIEKVETKLASIEDTLGFIVERLDFYLDQTQRHIEVLNEQNESHLQAQGEGVKLNRKRLENHEVRIGRLESAG